MTAIPPKANALGETFSHRALGPEGSKMNAKTQAIAETAAMIGMGLQSLLAKRKWMDKYDKLIEALGDGHRAIVERIAKEAEALEKLADWEEHDWYASCDKAAEGILDNRSMADCLISQ